MFGFIEFSNILTKDYQCLGIMSNHPKATLSGGFLRKNYDSLSFLSLSSLIAVSSSKPETSIGPR